MFLYLAYQNVHQPQQAPAEYETQYEFIQNKQRRTLAGRSCIFTIQLLYFVWTVC